MKKKIIIGIVIVLVVANASYECGYRASGSFLLASGSFLLASGSFLLAIDNVQRFC